MNQPLKEFRSHYLDFILDLIWRQWSAIGVAGYSKMNENQLVDPEALLLFSATMARYDVRLFDEILDWLRTNGGMININRIKNILKQEAFSGRQVLAAIARYLLEVEKQKKWQPLCKKGSPVPVAENLFCRKTGAELKVLGEPDPLFADAGFLRTQFNLRGYSQQANSHKNAAFIFKLRSLFGLSARCEIILFLLTHTNAHPSHIARKTYFNQKTIQDALVEMTWSELFHVSQSGREKYYSINKKEWLKFLQCRTGSDLHWINWPPIFSALEQIWLTINQPTFAELNDIMKASELRILFDEIRSQMDKTQFAYVFTDDHFYSGSEYLEVFFENMDKLMNVFN